VRGHEGSTKSSARHQQSKHGEVATKHLGTKIFVGRRKSGVNDIMLRKLRGSELQNQHKRNETFFIDDPRFDTSTGKTAVGGGSETPVTDRLLTVVVFI